MHVVSNVYQASRENTSRFEDSKKEFSLHTIRTDRSKDIKQTLSESGPESLLASHGKYVRTRTFAVGQAKRAVLAFSEEKQRVDGFVMNKDKQLVSIKSYDLPKELREIRNSEAFEAFLKDVHTRLIELSNGDFRLNFNQGLKGGVYSVDGNIDEIKEELEKISRQLIGNRHESRVIIVNKLGCDYSISLIYAGAMQGQFCSQAQAVLSENENNIASGAARGLLLKSTLGSLFGSKGYISLKVKTQFHHYLVVCAFNTSFSIFKNNSVKVIVRSLDEEGNVDIEEKGIESSGRVTDKSKCFSKWIYHDGSSSLSKYTERFYPVGLTCHFDNEKKTYFTFVFKPKEEHIFFDYAGAKDNRLRVD